MTVAAVSRAYAARCGEYVDLFGQIDAASEIDRTAILSWARTVKGRVIDVGCGPGQWTDYLAQQGIDVEGVDPTPEFVAAARKRYPSRRFRAGQANQLDVDAGSLGGILSWYSLIHTEPAQIDAAFAEFAQVLRPGGGLALGFFEGPKLETFDHAIITAYYWPIEALSLRLETAGFAVTSTRARTDPGVRRQGLILAERLA